MMSESEKKELSEYLQETAPSIQAVFIPPAEAVFEENVRMNCYYCSKYGRSWRCPPNLPDIDFVKMFQEFDDGLFLCLACPVEQKSLYESVRNESSIALHKILLQLETWMWNHDRPGAVSFGAGSCKLCKGGCGPDRCNNPSMSRSPLEATGVNVIKTAQKYGIQIHFPADQAIIRAGMILWQNPGGGVKINYEIYIYGGWQRHETPASYVQISKIAV